MRSVLGLLSLAFIHSFTHSVSNSVLACSGLVLVFSCIPAAVCVSLGQSIQCLPLTAYMFHRFLLSLNACLCPFCCRMNRKPLRSSEFSHESLIISKRPIIKIERLLRCEASPYIFEERAAVLGYCRALQHERCRFRCRPCRSCHAQLLDERLYCSWNLMDLRKRMSGR